MRVWSTGARNRWSVASVLNATSVDGVQGGMTSYASHTKPDMPCLALHAPHLTSHTPAHLTSHSAPHLLLGHRVDEGGHQLEQPPEHCGGAVQVQVAQALHVVVLEHVKDVLQGVEVQVGGAKACEEGFGLSEKRVEREKQRARLVATGTWCVWGGWGGVGGVLQAVACKHLWGCRFYCPCAQARCCYAGGAMQPLRWAPHCWPHPTSQIPLPTP